MFFWLGTAQRADRERQAAPSRAGGLKRLSLRPSHAGGVSQPCAFVQNFWQRYASDPMAAPEACVANKGHTSCSVAKLCFLTGKIILPVTPPR